MKTFLHRITIIIILLISLLLNCTNEEIKKQILIKNRLVKINNLIIEELNSQDFDIIRTIPQKSQYLVNVKINNKPETMVISTGFPLTILKKENYLKFRLKKITDFNELKTIYKTFFNNKAVKLPPVIVADLFEIGETKIQSLPLFIGNDNISYAILGCDFLNLISAVFICNPGAICISNNQVPAKELGTILKNNGYYEIDLIEAMDRILFVPISFGKNRGIAILNTSSKHTIIDSTKVEINTSEIHQYYDYYAGNLTGHHYYFVTKDNIESLKSIYLDNLQIGNFNTGNHFEAIYTKLVKTGSITLADQKYQILGYIGIDLLIKYSAIIDYGNRKLYLINF